MGKLFAFEEDKSSSDSGLIIDKLLDKKKQPSSPMSLTADLLKQRDQINEDVQNHIDEQDEDKENEESSEEEIDDDSESEEEESDKDDKDKEDKEEDVSDKDSLNSLIGSGLKEDKEVAEESLSDRVTLRNVFKPLHVAHEQYMEQLSPFNLALEALPAEQQPVVYVKEAIIETITRLNKLANSYIENIKSNTETYSESLKKMNERLVVLTNLVENNKHQFTHKLVRDRDIISALSFKGHSDPRETARVLVRYLIDSNSAISLMVNNEFNDIKKSLTSKTFTEENNDLVYHKQLPGFVSVRVGMVPYQNYLKTKLEDYQYYAVKSFKVEDLYELPGISITEDKEIEYIVKTLNDLVVSTGISLDTLKGVIDHFYSFVNDLKVLSYDVQNDKYSNLAELGIDANVQDFIKFKLATEALLNNINLSMNYLSGMSSVLDICLELSE